MMIVVFSTVLSLGGAAFLFAGQAVHEEQFGDKRLSVSRVASPPPSRCSTATQ